MRPIQEQNQLKLKAIAQLKIRLMARRVHVAKMETRIIFLYFILFTYLFIYLLPLYSTGWLNSNLKMNFMLILDLFVLLIGWEILRLKTMLKQMKTFYLMFPRMLSMFLMEILHYGLITCPLVNSNFFLNFIYFLNINYILGIVTVMLVQIKMLVLQLFSKKHGLIKMIVFGMISPTCALMK